MLTAPRSNIPVQYMVDVGPRRLRVEPPPAQLVRNSLEHGSFGLLRGTKELRISSVRVLCYLYQLKDLLTRRNLAQALPSLYSRAESSSHARYATLCTLLELKYRRRYQHRSSLWFSSAEQQAKRATMSTMLSSRRESRHDA